MAEILGLSKRSGLRHTVGIPRLSAWDRWRLRRAPRFRRLSVALGGHRVDITDPFWHLHSLQEIFEAETYLFEAATDRPLIIDCGANIGLSVLYFKLLYPNASVSAFEPDPDLCEVMGANLAAFKLTDVTVHQSAVWSANTQVHFVPDGSVGGHLVDPDAKAEGFTVNAERLRDILDRHVDLLKMDIEGAEFAVLRDCEDRLQNVDALVCEMHGRQGQVQEIHELLALVHRAGFRYHLKEANPVEHPLVSSERRARWLYDLQLNLFAFREMDG